MARKAHQSGRGGATNPRQSKAPSKPGRGLMRADGVKTPPSRASAFSAHAKRAKAPVGSRRLNRRGARGAGGGRESAERLAVVESAIGGLGAALDRLESALVKFAEGAARLDGGLERLTGAVRELESWIKKPIGVAEKIQGHAANIETKLERSKVEHQRALDLIGLKLDRIVNGVAELRRTVSPPSQRVGPSFA